VSRPSYFGRFLGNFSGSVVVAAACGRFLKHFSNIARRVNFEYNFGKSSPPPSRCRPATRRRVPQDPQFEFAGFAELCLPAMRDLDVVIYGATGFTGRLVAAYLAARSRPLPHRSPLRIGLAGRCADRLHNVRAEAAATSGHANWDPPLLVAASDDEAALHELAAKTRVVLSAAGPFTLCGTPLVRACVDECTDYVDINGEPPASDYHSWRVT
jgi:hypothetical protein